MLTPYRTVACLRPWRRWSRCRPACATLRCRVCRIRYHRFRRKEVPARRREFFESPYKSQVPKGQNIVNCKQHTFPPNINCDTWQADRSVFEFVSWFPQHFNHSRSVHVYALKRNSVEFENILLIKVPHLKVGLLWNSLKAIYLAVSLSIAPVPSMRRDICY